MYYKIHYILLNQVTHPILQEQEEEGWEGQS